MLQYRYDTQLLIEGQGLDEDEITDWILENMKGDSLICVGDDVIIGSNVFITEDVPPHTKVRIVAPELIFKTKE